MNLKQKFEEFWQENRYLININNPKRFHDNLVSKLEGFADTTELDEYVDCLKSARETTRQIVVMFYEFLKEYDGEDIDSPLFEKKYYDYPFERQLEIAKYLHEPKSRTDIQEHFSIDERTLRADLLQLEEGIQVLGATIRIQKEEEHREIYTSVTMHPVFLPLNLTEVYALTVYLDKVIENDPNADVIRNVSERIKCQLSDYAWNKLFPDEERIYRENEYISDSHLARSRAGIIGYLLKSGAKCKFFWQGEEYEGTLAYTPDKEYPFSAKLLDGTVLDAPLNEIDFIVESLEYK